MNYKQKWTYDEDGRSYILDETYDYNYADGVTVPHVITEYKYMPLNMCEAPEALYSVYQADNNDTVTVYETQKENDYIVAKDCPDSVGTYWYVSSTCAYPLDWLEETYNYDLISSGIIQFDENELVITYRGGKDDHFLRIKN